METVLSDEIQVGDYLEGLPIRVESLEKIPQISDASDMTIGSSYDGGPSREYGMPSADQVQQIVDMAKQARYPSFNRQDGAQYLPGMCGELCRRRCQCPGSSTGYVR